MRTLNLFKGYLFRIFGSYYMPGTMLGVGGMANSGGILKNRRRKIKYMNTTVFVNYQLLCTVT